MAKAKTTAKTAPKAAAPRKAVATDSDTPETKRTVAAQKAATEKLFANADDAVQRGLPPEMTIEQHENHVRRQALGY